MNALKIFLVLSDKIKVAVAYGFSYHDVSISPLRKEEKERIHVKRKINKNRLIHCTLKVICGSGITMVTVYLFIDHHGHNTCFTKLTQALTNRAFQAIKNHK